MYPLFYKSDFSDGIYDFLRENDGAEETLASLLLNKDDYGILP